MACQLVVHARRVADMGFLSPEAFQSIVAAQRMALPYLPPVGAETIWLRGAYQVGFCALNPGVPYHTHDLGSCSVPKSATSLQHQGSQVQFMHCLCEVAPSNVLHCEQPLKPQ